MLDGGQNAETRTAWLARRDAAARCQPEPRLLRGPLVPAGQRRTLHGGALSLPDVRGLSHRTLLLRQHLVLLAEPALPAVLVGALWARSATQRLPLELSGNRRAFGGLR